MEYINNISAIVGLIVVIGGVIFATFKLIEHSSVKVKTEMDTEMKKMVEKHDAEVKELRHNYESEIKDVREKYVEDMKTINIRLSDLDLWRKEMNGQLRLMNERQSFTNQILSEQKNQLQLLTETINSVSISLATMSEAIKNIKNS